MVTIEHLNAGAQGAIPHGSRLFLRPNAGIIELSDADRLDFLQRMTSNNVATLKPGQAMVTVLTSPTARIVHVFTVICREDSLWLLPAEGDAAALARHLRGQIFFLDKVKVRDLSDLYQRMRVTDPNARANVREAGLEVAEQENAWRETGGVFTLTESQWEVAGVEVIVDVEQSEPVIESLQAAGAQLYDDMSVYDSLRIESGLPAVGAELTSDYSPLEAGLGWACAEDKGCYTGQEIIARQRTYDKVTRTLIGLRSDLPMPTGSAVTFEGRDMGTVTSSAISALLGGPIALAIIKRPANEVGTTVLVNGNAAQVVALPFIQE